MAECEICESGIGCHHVRYIDGMELCDSCAIKHLESKLEFCESLLDKQEKARLDDYVYTLKKESYML